VDTGFAVGTWYNENAAMPLPKLTNFARVRPIHHGCNGKYMWLIFCHFFCSLKPSAHLPGRRFWVPYHHAKMTQYSRHADSCKTCALTGTSVPRCLAVSVSGAVRLQSATTCHPYRVCVASYRKTPCCPLVGIRFPSIAVRRTCRSGVHGGFCVFRAGYARGCAT
jgi:hypothetical protein